jgi:peptidoglycan/LPS O-acetylase OafA/YrhL
LPLGSIATSKGKPIATQSSNSFDNASVPLRPNNFDLIRLVAAVQVLIIHGFEHLGLKEKMDLINDSFRFWINAFPGVPIFFVISGFLISRSFERENRVKTYAVNRLLRIYPALYVCFAVSILSVFIATPELILRTEIKDFAGWCFAQLSIGQFYNPTFLRSYGVGVLNGSLWTIPVELQFYMALPVLYVVLGLSKNKKNRQLIGVALGFLLVSFLHDRFGEQNPSLFISKLIKVSMLPYFWMFLLGVLAQRNWASIRRFFEDRILLWIVGYIATVLVLSRLEIPVTGNGQSPLATLALAGLVLAAAFSCRGVSQAALRGNDISYGIYIYHMVVINFLIAFGYRGDWLHLGAAIVCTIVLGILSWNLVEKVALAYKPRNKMKSLQNEANDVH